MSSTVQKVIVSLIVVNLGVSAWAADRDNNEKAAAQDFQIRQQNLLDRYEDYYTRMALIDRENARRERGAEQQHADRIKLKNEAEKIRREFKRPKSESDLAAERAYEAQVKENKKELDRARAEFVRQRQALEKMENGTSRIPDNEELGIMQDETL